MDLPRSFVSNLPRHFHVVDPWACFTALLLVGEARLLTVASSLYDFSLPTGGEDSAQDPVCTVCVLLLNHHSPDNELQKFSCGLVFKPSSSGSTDFSLSTPYNDF